MREEAEFCIEDAGGMFLASTQGQRDEAWREIQHYAAQYADEAPLTIYEVTRKVVTDAGEAALRIAGATGPLGDPEVSGDGAPGATAPRPPTKQEDAVLHHAARAAGKVVAPGKLVEGMPAVDAMKRGAAERVMSGIEAGRSAFRAGKPREGLSNESERIGWDEAAHDAGANATAPASDVVPLDECCPRCLRDGMVQRASGCKAHGVQGTVNDQQEKP